MWNIILESIRALIILFILIAIWRIGNKRDLNLQKGWGFIIVGWSLILFGSLLDITDNFDELNQFIVIGNTETEAFLEKLVGFLMGYILLFIGFLYWLPAGAKRFDTMKDAFVSTVSHELRTPLTSIFGSLRLVDSGKLGELPPKAKECINIALRNTHRLTLLVNDVLDIQKLEQGELSFNLTPNDLLSLVEQSITDNAAYGEEYNVVFQIAGDGATGTILIDSNRFIQVMSNLLSNAAKFSAANNIVTIHISDNGNTFRVAVSDTGSGIPDAFKAQIFKPFTQVDSTDTRHRAGTGLGLSIAKSLMEQMNGRLSFESTEGVGSTFYLDLPKAR